MIDAYTRARDLGLDSSQCTDSINALLQRRLSGGSFPLLTMSTEDSHLRNNSLQSPKTERRYGYGDAAYYFLGFGNVDESYLEIISDIVEEANALIAVWSLLAWLWHLGCNRGSRPHDPLLWGCREEGIYPHAKTLGLSE